MEKQAMQNYVDALNSNDPAAVGAIFADECYFSDGATRIINLPDGVGTSPAEVEAVFQGIMSQFKVSVEILKMNDRSMEYDVYLGEEVTLPCVGAVTLDENGKVKEYIIRPR